MSTAVKWYKPTPARDAATPNRYVAGDLTLTIAIESVDPNTALDWLDEMGRNRKVRARKVARYARLISSDRWYAGVGTVVFDEDGYLIDGQHRLMGIVEADKAALMVVVRGVHRDAKYWIDTGSARTPGDALSMAGVESNESTTATALGFLLRYRRAGHTNTEWSPENEDLRDGIKEFPDIGASLEATKAGRTAAIHGSHGVFAFCHYVFAKQDEPAADEFFRGVLQGLGVVSETDPRHLLRERLQKEATLHAKISTQYVIKLVFKAWQLWRNGDERVMLRVRQRGPAQEGWPDIGPVPGIRD